MGLLIAILLILLWSGHLFWSLVSLSPESHAVWWILHVLIQTHLSTGLFITAHDAMHGTVHRHHFVNRASGMISAFLYAGMFYKKLQKKHFEHHKYPGTPDDPDFHKGNKRFLNWWFAFMMEYISIYQLLIMAILFNILLIWIPQTNLIILWVLPAILSTFQLFYFGTFRPHSEPHSLLDIKHKARSQSRNHLLAFISCYFFGYHLEHHQSPSTPWWKLFHLKKEGND